ncbi:MAG: agmatinase [Verrucomicrobiales bacterium]|nr:agmatinase [Verrucomicrobiales bacterium]
MSIIPPEIPFLASAREPKPGCPLLLGVPYDKTASFRKGTREGPDGIRTISEDGIETYSPIQDRDLEEIHFHDLGNLEVDPSQPPEEVVAALNGVVAAMYRNGGIPIVLGGEHSISPGAVRAAFDAHPDLVVIQIDAHADLREEYEGSRHSHACAMRRILDFLPSDRLLQVGIRSGTREEYREMHAEERYVAPNAAALTKALEGRRFQDSPIYVTFDIDAFDPAEVPGTGTPEAGGISWETADSMRAVLEGKNIVGFDLVELAPGLDPSGISSVLAAKLLREWLLTMATSS